MIKKTTIAAVALLAFAFSAVAEMVSQETALAVAEGFIRPGGFGARLLPDRSVASVSAWGNLWIVALEPSGYIEIAGSTKCAPILSFSSADFAEPEVGSPFAAKLTGDSTMVETKEADDSLEDNPSWAKYTAPVAKKRTLLSAKPTGTDGTGYTPYVAPLLGATWNQTAPFNDLSPYNYFCGCMATAAGQELRYWRWPYRYEKFRQSTHGVRDAQFNYSDFVIRPNGLVPFNWDKVVASAPNPASTPWAADKEATYNTAWLSLWAQSLTGMGYKPGGSGGTRQLAGTAEEYWYEKGRGMTYWNDGYTNLWNAIKADLDWGSPIQINTAAHQMVIDGYAVENYGQEDEVDWINLNLGYGNAVYWDNLKTAVTEGTYSGKLASFQTGFRPQKIVQFEPVPKVCSNDVTLVWHMAPCYTNRTTGFTLEVAKAGGAANTIQIETHGETTTYTASGLEMGGEYTFSVCPVMVDGEGTGRTNSVTTTIGEPKPAPEFLSVSSVACGIELLQQDIFMECAYGIVNKIDLTCSESTTEVVPYSSHLTILPDSQLNVTKNGNVFTVNVDATAMDSKWSGEMLILTLVAKNEDGTEAYKNLMLRFNSMRQVINGTFDAADGDSNSAVWFCGDTTIDAKGRAVSFGASAFQGTGKVTLADSVGGGSFTFQGLDGFAGTLKWAPSVIVNLPADLGNFRGTLWYEKWGGIYTLSSCTIGQYARVHVAGSTTLNLFNATINGSISGVGYVVIDGSSNFKDLSDFTGKIQLEGDGPVVSLLAGQEKNASIDVYAGTLYIVLNDAQVAYGYSTSQIKNNIGTVVFCDKNGKELVKWTNSWVSSDNVSCSFDATANTWTPDSTTNSGRFSDPDRWSFGRLPIDGEYVLVNATYMYGPITNILDLAEDLHLGYVRVVSVGGVASAVLTSADDTATLYAGTFENMVSTTLYTDKIQPTIVIPQRALNLAEGIVVDCEIDYSIAPNLHTPNGVNALSNSNYWKGTVVFTDCTFDAYNTIYGNAMSKLLFTGATGRIYYETPIESEVVLEDLDGFPAWHWNGGYTTQSPVINRLSGSGTLKTSNAIAETVVIKDVSGFNGTFDLAAKTIAIADSKPSSNIGNNGCLHICKTVSIASGKTWMANGGLYLGTGGALSVNGEFATGSGIVVYGSGASLTIEDGASVKVAQAISGDYAPTLNFKAGTYKFASNSDITETRTVNFCADYGKCTTLDAGGRKITLGSNFFSGSGDVRLTSSETNGMFVIQGLSPAFTGTIYADISAGVTIAGDISQSSGKISFSDISLTVSSSNLGNFEVGAGATLAVMVSKSHLMSGLEISTNKVYLVDGGALLLRDNNGKELNYSLVEDKYTLLADPEIIATYLLDYEFNGDMASSGTIKNALHGGSIYENSELYTRSIPYYNNTFSMSGEEWTAFVRCIMPQNNSDKPTILLMFGQNGSNDLLGLVSGTADNTVALADRNGIVGSAVYIDNATTKHHVYAIVKTTNRVQLYVDGVLKVSESKTLNINKTFQFGSVHGGNHTSYGSCDDSNSLVDYLRFYDFAVGQSMIDDEVQEPDPTTLTVTPGTGEVDYGTEVVAKCNDSTAKIMYKKHGDTDYTEYTSPIVLNVAGPNIYIFQVRDADDNVVVEDSAHHYNVAEPAVPVAVWHGDFSAEQSGYTLELNGNSLSSDKSTITIDQSVGVVVTNNTGTFAGGFTVLFKYSNLNLSLAARQVLAVTKLTDADNRVGAEINASGKACGIWAGNSWNDSGTYNTMTSDQTSGVLAYTHYSTSGNNGGGTGTQLFCLKDNKLTTIMDASTLGSTGDVSKYKGVSVGGPVTAISGASAATDMQITGIAVFEGVLAEGSIKAYVWPEPEPEPEYEGPAPIAVWVAGEFDDDRSAHGGLEFALNGNTTNALGQIVIGNSTTLGATIAISDGFDNATMLVKYSIPTGGASVDKAAPVSMFVNYDLGAYANSGLTDLDGYWWNNSQVKTDYPFSSSAPSIPQEGYLLISAPANSNNNSGDHYTAVYVGTSVSDLSGGEANTVNHRLRFTGPTNRVTSVGIGGPTVAGAKPWQGMVIKSVALFDEWVTTNVIANYKFPERGAVLPEDSDRYAIEPVAKWVNDFKTTEKNGCTLSVSGTTAAKGDSFGGVLTIGNAAAVIDVTYTNALTVLVKYRATPDIQSAPVVAFGGQAAVTFDSGICTDTNVTRQLSAYYSFIYDNSRHRGIYAVDGNPTLSPAGGYLVCARKKDACLAYVGNSLDTMTGGECTTDMTLSNSTLRKIGIGGQTELSNNDANMVPFTGFVVEKVVVFSGYYTPDQIRYVPNPEDGDTLSIADGATWNFAAGTTRTYTNIGTLNSGGTIAITNASELAEGSYKIAEWTNPKLVANGQYSDVYGRVGTLTTEGLPAGLTAELVYGARAIYLRVYNPDTQSEKPTLKVWPYGDSITEGFNGAGSRANYRVLLAQKLTLLGYNVEMVGVTDKIQTANNDPSKLYNAIDPSGVVATNIWQWHSAKHGAPAKTGISGLGGRAALVENVDTLCAQVGKPDVVLLLIGVNDLSQTSDVDGVFDAWKETVNRILVDLPDTKVVVSTLLYSNAGNSGTVNPRSTTFNQKVWDVFDSMPEAWSGRVLLADLNSLVDKDGVGILVNTSNDKLHPDWWGHDKMADGWLTQITNFYPYANGTFPSSTPLPTVDDSELGAAAKEELADYRNGFKLCRTIDVATGIAGDPYSSTGEGATENFEKVAYFVEYVRADNNAHKWVWVDMDAFGDADLASVGLPTTIRQQVVTKLHVKSNHNGIDDVASDVDTVNGFIEFSPNEYDGSVSNVTGAATGWVSSYDWNDSLLKSGSGSVGCMQVHRISPSSGRGGQVLFAFNNWNQSTTEAEFGIGNFAQHFYGGGTQSMDYTYTKGLEKMNAAAYSVKRIEIWTKADEPEPVAKIGETPYETLQGAINAANASEAESVEIELLATCTENVELATKITVRETESGQYTGTLSGSGTLVLAGTRSAAMQFGEWTGTVVLPSALTELGGFRFDYYGISGSTIRLASQMSGWIQRKSTSMPLVVDATIEIPAETSLAITGFSPSFKYLFAALKGSGAFAVSAEATSGNQLANAATWTEDYSAYILVSDVSAFNGTLTVTGDAGIAVGSVRPGKNEVGGRILLTSADATLAATASPTPETTVAGSYVKLVEGVYSVETYKTITFKNYDDSSLYTITNAKLGDTPVYGGETPTKAETEQYTYTFNGWNPEIATVTGDAAYTAQFTEKEKTSSTDYKVPYSWFAEYVPEMSGSDLDELANMNAQNGLKYWQCYVLGLDPTNETSKFLATIRMNGTTPIVEYSPTNTTLGNITYILQGKPALTNDWFDCPSFNEPGDTNRFFRVKVTWE